MLIRITNKCTMGCSHCMIDASSPDGEHMKMDVFKRALKFARASGSLGLLLSGGEPFEHPQLEEMVSLAKKNVTVVIVATNGLFTLDPGKLKMANRLDAFIQVTNDERYYPKRIDESKIKDMMIGKPKGRRGVSLEKDVRIMYGCKRSKAAGYKSTRISPFCFNLRSITRRMGFREAISMLEYSGKFCSPSINVDGTIVAGEADTCFPIGDVQDNQVSFYKKTEAVEKALKKMKCNLCGLVNNLDEEHANAIGEINEICTKHRGASR